MNEKIKQWLELSVELGIHIECNRVGHLEDEIGILFNDGIGDELVRAGGVITTEQFEKWLNQKA